MIHIIFPHGNATQTQICQFLDNYKSFRLEYQTKIEVKK